MKTRLARSRTKARKLPSISPAVHFLRPIFLTVAGLVAYGVWHDNACALTTAAALGFVTLLPALALHSGYRSKQEHREKILCG